MRLIRWEHFDKIVKGPSRKKFHSPERSASSNAPLESISPHFADEGWQSPLLHLETLFHTGDSEVSVDLTVQAANLLSEKFSSQAKKLINLSKNTVQSALEIQQRIVMPSSENSECFFLQLFHSISV